jgi:hypothetical protein
MEYRPLFASFVASFLYGLSPAILAGIVMYFLAESARLIMWIASGIMVILSLFFLIQSIFVHLQKLYLDDYLACMSNPMLRVEIRWQDVISAVLRERENLMSRIDRLLIIKSANHVLSFNTSILSKKDEQEVLRIVGYKTHLVILKDKPAI